MRKAYYFLSAMLVLDFSGSMDQIIDKKPKHLLVKESVGIYLNSQSRDQVIDVLAFGARPENKCRDFQQKKLPVQQASDWIQKLQPGALGKTPLAESIRRVKDKVLSPSQIQSIDQVILVTDGADTCGEDPCAELLRLDQKLSKINKKVIVDLIGFDLKEERSLACFKDLKDRLKQVSLQIHQAGDSEELLRKLSQASQRQSLSPGKGSVRVSGSPVNEIYTLRKNAIKKPFKKWTGDFDIQLPAGSYTIESSSGDKKISLNIYEKQHLVIYYADFFKIKSGLVQNTEAAISFKALPEKNVLEMHGDVKPVELNGTPQELKFGIWEIVATNPPWIKDQIKFKIDIRRGQKLDSAQDESLNKQIDWQIVDAGKEGGVLKIGESKILVFPNQKKIPYKKGWRLEWLAK